MLKASGVRRLFLITGYSLKVINLSGNLNIFMVSSFNTIHVYYGYHQKEEVVRGNNERSDA
jgi:hypothetical protein